MQTDHILLRYGQSTPSNRENLGFGQIYPLSPKNVLPLGLVFSQPWLLRAILYAVVHTPAVVDVHVLV